MQNHLFCIIIYAIADLNKMVYVVINHTLWRQNQIVGVLLTAVDRYIPA